MAAIAVKRIGLEQGRTDELRYGGADRETAALQRIRRVRGMNFV
jgi:hypothetical protein